MGWADIKADIKTEHGGCDDVRDSAIRAFRLWDVILPVRLERNRTQLTAPRKE